MGVTVLSRMGPEALIIPFPTIAGQKFPGPTAALVHPPTNTKRDPSLKTFDGLKTV